MSYAPPMDSSTMYLDCLTGSETYKNGSAQYRAFWCPTNAQLALCNKELFIGEAAARKDGINVRVTSSMKYPAFERMGTEFGFYMSQRFSLPEGSVIKVFGNLTRFGLVRKQASMYLRMRQGAALMKIGMSLLCESGKSRFKEAYIKGHMDVLTMKEVMALGIPVKIQFAGGSSALSIAKCFQIVEILPATAAKVSVTTKKVEVVSEGKMVEKTVVVSNVKRRIQRNTPTKGKTKE